MLLKSGVGVFVSLSSCRSFLGVAKLQLPPSDFPPSVPPPIAYIGTTDKGVVALPLHSGLQMPAAGLPLFQRSTAKQVLMPVCGRAPQNLALASFLYILSLYCASWHCLTLVLKAHQKDLIHFRKPQVSVSDPVLFPDWWV